MHAPILGGKCDKLCNRDRLKRFFNDELPHSSANTSEPVSYAQAALKATFRFGSKYRKAGVMLTGLVPIETWSTITQLAHPGITTFGNTGIYLKSERT